MKRVLASRVLALLAIAPLLGSHGCGRPGVALPPAEPPAPTTPAIAESADPIAPAEPPIPEAATEVASTPTAPWRLSMTPDPGFLAGAPPTPNPGQYKRWRQRGRIAVGHSHLSTAMYSADEQWFLVMSDAEATARIYDAKTRKILGNHPIDGFAPGAWARGEILIWPTNARGRAFLVGNDRGLCLVSATTGGLIETFSADPVWELRWSPDTRYLVTTTSDISTQTTVVRVYARDGESLSVLSSIDGDERVDGLALSRDNRLAAMVTYPSDEVRLVDLETGERRWHTAGPKYVGTVDISPDGDRVAVGGNAVVIFDASDPGRSARYTKRTRWIGAPTVPPWCPHRAIARCGRGAAEPARDRAWARLG
jgi:hypothetical protein